MSDTLTTEHKKLIHKLIGLWNCGKPHHKCDCTACELHEEIGETAATVFNELEAMALYAEPESKTELAMQKGDYLRDQAKDQAAEKGV